MTENLATITTWINDCYDFMIVGVSNKKNSELSRAQATAAAAHFSAGGKLIQLILSP